MPDTAASRILGRQKCIEEKPIVITSEPSPTTTDETKQISGAVRPVIKAIEIIAEFGSPDSPLTKMNIMPNPLPKGSQTQINLDGLLSPKSVRQLEFPTPERLLPIGHKEGEKAQALSISDISHLKQESSFEKSEVR